MEIIWEGPDDRDATLLSKFMEDMMPTKLFCLSPARYDQLWVFWSQDASDHISSTWDTQRCIKTALSAYYPFYLDHVMIQFWAPEMIEGRRHLTTTLQPFALSNLRNEKLNEYRKHCVGYKLLVEDEEENGPIMEDGIVCRVFQNQSPEFGPDMSYYSVKDYPQRDFALSCGIKSTVALPVFELSGVRCVGVLELLFPIEFTRDNYFEWDVQRANLALKRACLRTIDNSEIRAQINGVYEVHIQKEIKAAVKQVCKTYNLSHAITWVSCAPISCDRNYNDSPVSFQGELLVASRLMSFFADNHKLGPYFFTTWTAPLRVRQGLVGKAFSSRNLQFCSDVCQLRVGEYPFVHFARQLGVGACFAVCLRTISTGNHEFVIEFSLSRKKAYSQDLQGLCWSIVATLKQHLKGFDVPTPEMEKEIFTEGNNLGESYVKPSIGEDENLIYRAQSKTAFSSFKTISTPTTSETEDTSHSIRTTESTLNSTCRKLISPSCKRSKHVNEWDQAILNRSESIASTKCLKLFGYAMSTHQTHIPAMNQRRRGSTHFEYGSLSPALSFAAHYVRPCTPVSDVELMTIKVKYKEDIIKFSLPPSSSKADLVQNVIMRLRMLNDKAFVIKYLDDSHEQILLATDKDVQDCLVRAKWRGNNLIRMLIHLEEDVQDLQ